MSSDTPTDPTERAALATHLAERIDRFLEEGWSCPPEPRDLLRVAAGLLAAPPPPTDLDLKALHEACARYNDAWNDRHADATILGSLAARIRDLVPAAPAAQPTITVDPEANAAYVQLGDGQVIRTVEISGTVNADYDEHARLLGVEILDVAPAAQPDPRVAELRSIAATLHETSQEYDQRSLRSSALGHAVAVLVGRADEIERETPAAQPDHCPRCDSPDPKKHPAMQFEGEVQVCPHPWHSPAAQSDDEAAVDRVAEGLVGYLHAEHGTVSWSDYDERGKDSYRDMARAALAALRGQQQ